MLSCPNSYILLYCVYYIDVKVGFEQFDLTVHKNEGSVEICVAVHQNIRNVPIPDIHLELSTLDYGDASKLCSFL